MIKIADAYGMYSSIKSRLINHIPEYLDSSYLPKTRETHRNFQTRTQFISAVSALPGGASLTAGLGKYVLRYANEESLLSPVRVNSVFSFLESCVPYVQDLFFLGAGIGLLYFSAWVHGLKVDVSEEYRQMKDKANLEEVVVNGNGNGNGLEKHL